MQQARLLQASVDLYPDVWPHIRNIRNLRGLSRPPHSAPGRLVDPASHGCVRMANSEVIELAETIHNYGAPKSAGIIGKLVDNPKMTRKIWLKKKVPFRIVK